MSNGFNGQKQERVYEILSILMESKYDSCIAMGPNKSFRVCANKEGSKTPYRLEVNKRMLNMTIQEILDENEAYFQERQKSAASNNGFAAKQPSTDTGGNTDGGFGGSGGARF